MCVCVLAFVLSIACVRVYACLQFMGQLLEGIEEGLTGDVK